MQKVNRILIELQPIAPARQALRLDIIVDCRHTDASKRVSFWEKKSGAIVGTIIANYRRLRSADGRTLFQFRQ